MRFFPQSFASFNYCYLALAKIFNCRHNVIAGILALFLISGDCFWCVAIKNRVCSGLRVGTIY